MTNLWSLNSFDPNSFWIVDRGWINVHGERLQEISNSPTKHVALSILFDDYEKTGSWGGTKQDKLDIWLSMGSSVFGLALNPRFKFRGVQPNLSVKSANPLPFIAAKIRSDRILPREFVCDDCGITHEEAVALGDSFDFDHIVPRSRGGRNIEANVQILCRKRCHKPKTYMEVKSPQGLLLKQNTLFD